jgi:hypothetical protein
MDPMDEQAGDHTTSAIQKVENLNLSFRGVEDETF